MKLLDGKKLSEIVKQEIKEEVDRLVAANHKRPNLAAVLVGNDGASETYVQHKVRACKEVGFDSTLIRLPETTTEESLLAQIDRLNKSSMVDGFIVQLPLPKHIDVEKVTQAIKPGKDVDGFHPVNVGRMAQGLPCYLPATPYGILQLLERNGIETSGKDCVVLGRSNIVGTPISILLSRNQYPGNCTVTVCHSRTKNIEKYTRRADILIVALGQPEFVTGKMVKKGAVVVDVGITRMTDESKRSGYRLAGDVKYDEVAPKCSFITPVPGGVGPMTVVSLLLNTLKAAKKEINYPE
ncbi:bifunctional 5,10-methylene-tetrahydrofolate dehydrogenase/5,10-methylene-tetrahydrofolate cyclohydrolase [Sphingobacteriales bacterium UPWRP_1]|nr:bifunctional 5,10-methylene-tetrahydrofolate dehydrogenase/5,10-methylene-tetrahydrofolate cyclohydrolase [Sphingobacteriales bacterium TSM_CSM]PSJ75160.1 bifunctional 5,10-methylene-tetrahydrofolate dehydrogenase/5,10-methylene-tetrahydrofolate cyclohydrolase [Sphingobacteriales bacterium UPWRP_1]